MSDRLAAPEEPRGPLAGNPQSLVAILTTEHFTLQTARAATISETTARASLFLGTVSGALVALAFLGQVSSAGGAFFAFGLVLFPALLFLGLATYDRVLQTSIEDVAYAQRINRIRRCYLDGAPELAAWLAPAAGEGAAAAIGAGGMRPGRWQMLVTIAGTIGVINSVIVGVLVALLVGLLTRDATALAAAAGVAAFVLGVALHQRHQARRRLRTPSPFDRPGL
jgi:Ca2+/Na+ antiporter